MSRTMGKTSEKLLPQTSPHIDLHPKFISLLIRGVKLIFTGSHISLAVAFKGLNVILGLYKRNYSLTRARSSALLLGRNKVPGQIKQGGGPDLACGPVFATCALDGPQNISL